VTTGSDSFRTRTAAALKNAALQTALQRAHTGFVEKRRQAVSLLPEFEALRDEGAALCEHTLSYLDAYLQRYESQLRQQGGQVHWAETPEQACEIIIDLCRQAGARHIAKGKSMVSEEIGLNAALESAGFEVVETDLGEYILQLAKEPPSHIIAPAVHKTRAQIAELFKRFHTRYGIQGARTEISELVGEARQVLRERFLRAEVGITGANFLIAETGSSVLVTNEGNGDLSSSLPPVHIVVAGIDKVVPTLEDATALLRLLGRSATGQELTAYTTLHTGPRRAQDLDGPQQYHVVLVDNGRSTMLGNEFRPMLRCIRCGACLNHCAVYGAVGGHAYAAVYPGPMGAVLTPLMRDLREAGDLAHACTLNGRCASVCPVKIPLPDLLRSLRCHHYAAGLVPRRQRWILTAWVWLAQRPRLYQALTGLLSWSLAGLGGRQHRLRHLPAASGWTQARDLPAPQGGTFQQAWRRQQSCEERG